VDDPSDPLRSPSRLTTLRFESVCWRPRTSKRLPTHVIHWESLAHKRTKESGDERTVRVNVSCHDALHLHSHIPSQTLFNSPLIHAHSHGMNASGHFRLNRSKGQSWGYEV